MKEFICKKICTCVWTPFSIITYNEIETTGGNTKKKEGLTVGMNYTQRPFKNNHKSKISIYTGKSSLKDIYHMDFNEIPLFQSYSARKAWVSVYTQYALEMHGKWKVIFLLRKTDTRASAYYITLDNMSSSRSFTFVYLFASAYPPILLNAKYYCWRVSIGICVQAGST